MCRIASYDRETGLWDCPVYVSLGGKPIKGTDSLESLIRKKGGVCTPDQQLKCGNARNQQISDGTLAHNSSKRPNIVGWQEYSGVYRANPGKSRH